MSAGFANWQGAAAGKARRVADSDRRETANPIRLTIRRVKFASSLFVGALMLGVVGNAMLLQTSRQPVAVAVNTAPQRTAAEPLAPAPRAVEAAVKDRPAAVVGTAESRGVDRVPVGSIAAEPPRHAKPHPRPPLAKVRPRKVDAIAAFLRNTKTAGATPSVR